MVRWYYKRRVGHKISVKQNHGIYETSERSEQPRVSLIQNNQNKKSNYCEMFIAQYGVRETVILYWKTILSG